MSALGVDVAARTITTIAAPYERAAQVMGGQGFGLPGEVWREIICRSAFSGLKDENRVVKVNRDHDKTRTIGRVLEFRDEPTGLIAEVKIARTALGDDTLGLAEDGCLGASLGFVVRPQDHDLDRSTRTRRIKHAYMDHLAFVDDPAYVGATVLAVRHASEHHAYTVDDFYDDPVMAWSHQRAASVRQRAAYEGSAAAIAEHRAFVRRLGR
jgi:HK97 family phage prohead protease